MRKLFAVLVFFGCQLAWAQSTPGVPRDSSGMNEVLDRRIQQEEFEKWAFDPQGKKQKAEAAKQMEAAQEFYAKASQFVELWQAFARELNDKKTFNAKLAKQVAKAFHDMEKSEGWPVGRPK